MDKNNRKQNNFKGGKPQQQKRPQKISNPDPMSNVRDMGRYGIRVIRDIAKGKFNFYNEGHIFRNIDFVMATIDEVQKKIYEANIHVMAMEYTYANSTDQVVKDLLMRDKRTSEAYNLVYSALSKIAATGDTRYLQILLNQLPRYKYNM